MRFDEYWEAVTKKFPELKDETTSTTVSVKSLKALMEKCHEKGRKLERGKNRFENVSKPQDPTDYLKDFFG